MAETSKILAQSSPAATSLTDVYTCGSSGGAAISSVTICNQSATPTTFRISLAVAGAADTAKQYLYYDIPLPGNDTFIATIGVSLANTDVLRAYVGAATVSINVSGVELS